MNSGKEEEIFVLMIPAWQFLKVLVPLCGLKPGNLVEKLLTKRQQGSVFLSVSERDLQTLITLLVREHCHLATESRLQTKN